MHVGDFVFSIGNGGIFIFTARMVASVIIFKGLVIGLWHLKFLQGMKEKDIIKVEFAQSNETMAYKDLNSKNLERSAII